MTSQRVERTSGSARAVTGGSGANGLIDFQKSNLSDLIRRGMKDFSYLIDASFSDSKTGRCA